MLWAEFTGAKETKLRSDLLVRIEERELFAAKDVVNASSIPLPSFSLVHHNPALQQGQLTFLKSKTQS